MPGNPSSSQTHVNSMLTNISVAYIQDQSDFIADKVFPIVPVEKQSDRYFVYNKDDWFRDEAQLRAPGTESAGGGYDIDNTPSYYCNKYAWHQDVSDDDRENNDDPLKPDEDATAFCTQKLLIKRETLWQSKYFKTGIWGSDYTGGSTKSGTQLYYWSDTANGTPIINIRNAKTDVKESTGYDPNTLVLGRDVFDVLCDHPVVLERIKYSQKAVVTTDLLASLFDIPRVLVANAVVNTAYKGATASNSFVFGKGALLCYSAPKPGLRVPSAGYTFAWNGLLGAGAYGNRVKNFRMENLESDRIEAEMAFDQKVVGSDLGCFFSGIVE